MISNQYQIQPNFRGNLLKEGLKFPQKKFNEVAKIYAEKTKGMPDLHLHGMQLYMDGHFYHSTYAIHSIEDIDKSGCRALIKTGDLKQMFKDYSPVKMAEELANITRKFAAFKKLDNLDKELDSLYAKRNNIESQIKNSTNFAEKDDLQVLLDKIERNIEYKEEKVKNIKHKYIYAENEFSKDWYIYEQ